MPDIEDQFIQWATDDDVTAIVRGPVMNIPLPVREATQRVSDTEKSSGFSALKQTLAELTNEPFGASILLDPLDAKRFRHYANLGKFDRAWEGDSLRVWNVDPNAAGAP